MKKFWFGLIAGLLVGGAVCVLYSQKVSVSADATGYTRGITEGSDKGEALGRQKQKSEDSLKAIPPKVVEVPKKKEPKRIVVKQKDPNDVNYTMDGDNVGEEKK